MRTCSPCLVLFLALGCASAQPPPNDPLAQLNQVARASYAQAKARALAEAGPVLYAAPDRLILLLNGERDEAPLIPPGYHELKAVDHVALGMHVLRATESAPLRLAIDGALSSLPRAGLTVEQLARSRMILEGALGVIDGTQALGSWEREVAPLLLASARDAAIAQLDLLHRGVTAFRARMGEGEWRRVHVVVVGAHMARDGELKVQYFQRLLHEPAEGARIVFAEGLWREEQGLDLLATHLLDGAMGAAFFGDAQRMHRDLLADAAAEYLPVLLP